MPALNRVMLIGNLTRDVDLKYLPSQTACAEFGLAINRKFKDAQGADREDVCFVDVTAFGKQAEVIAQYCTKGKPLFIEGRLQYETWEDKQGGGRRSKLSVVLENFQFLGGRDDGQGERGEQPQSQPQRQATQRPAPQRPAGRPATKPQQPLGDEQAFADDEIPF